jgi:outer membrane protein TolC
MSAPTPCRRAFLFFVLLLAASTLFGQESAESEWSLARVFSRLSEASVDTELAELATEQALQQYRQRLAQTRPSLNLELTPYSFDRRLVATGGAPPGGSGAGGGQTGSGGSADSEDLQDTQLSQSFSAGASLVQPLPTAGSLSGNISHGMSITRVGDGDASIVQEPRLGVQFSQPLFVNGSIVDLDLFSATNELARLGFRSAEIAELSRKNGTYFQTARSYINLATSFRSLELERRRLELLEEQVAEAETNAEQGVISQNELLSLRVQRNGQEQRVLNLELSVRRSELEVNRLLDTRGVAASELSYALPDLDPIGNLEELRDRADTDSSEILAALVARERARLESIVSDREFASNLSLSFSLAPQYPVTRVPGDDLGESFSDLFEEEAGWQLNGSLGLQLPLGDTARRRSLQRERAAAERVAMLELEQTRERVLDTLAELLLQRDVLRRRLELVQIDLDFERDRLENQRELAELGSATERSVQEVEIAVRAQENALYEAQTSLFLNTLDLLASSGGDLSAILSERTDNSD